MKAVRFHTNGGPEVLKYEEVDTPKPKNNEALIKLEAAGVNYIDIYQRSGQYGQHRRWEGFRRARGGRRSNPYRGDGRSCDLIECATQRFRHKGIRPARFVRNQLAGGE